MDNVEIWFRWVVGGLFALCSGVIAWLTGLVLGSDRHISTLETRIAVLEARPHVDPIEHAKVMTRLTEAITNLTLQVLESNKAQDRIWDKLEQISDELDKLRDLMKTQKVGA